MKKYKETGKHPNHLLLIVICPDGENEWLDKHRLARNAYLELGWIEEVPERIRLSVTKGLRSSISQSSSTIKHGPFSDEQVKIMEQALNGELFTKEDLICLSDHFRLRPNDWDSRDAINYWIHNVKSK
ncbi:MAG: hypothetical protein KAR20_04410 [Candidatus Heimdallarchaeota archaeon]|nr:hypothetical protein [Candidatus Heimdallarchaeota archaeon]